MRLFRLAFLLLPLLAQGGTLYKSVGPDGRPVYSDQPPTNGGRAQALEFADAPATPLPEAVLRYRAELQKSMQKRLTEARRTPTAAPILFTAAWCGYCRRAKAYLADKSVAYDEYDIDTEAGMRAMIEAGGGKGVPLLLWRGQRLQGFSPDSYDALFGKRQ